MRILTRAPSRISLNGEAPRCVLAVFGAVVCYVRFAMRCPAAEPDAIRPRGVKRNVDISENSQMEIRSPNLARPIRR